MGGGDFTVEFKATLDKFEDGDDWGSQVLSYKGFHVTIPNLDPWNNTAGDEGLAGKNAFPTAAGASLKNGLAFNSAFGGTHTIKIVFTEDTITYHLDGKEWVVYSSTVWNGGISDFIGYYVEGLGKGEVVFNAANLDITDVVISKGTSGDTPPAAEDPTMEEIVRIEVDASRAKTAFQVGRKRIHMGCHEHVPYVFCGHHWH